MSIIEISSPNDPRIIPYVDIRERDLTGRQHCFIAEGRVVIQVLIRSSCKLESFLFSDKQRKFADEIITNLDPSVPVYIASQSVLDAVAGFSVHRGLLAISHKKPSITSTELLYAMPDNAVVLAAIGIANHDNMGGIFRNAAAFGASAVLLDHTSCDPYYRKAMRVSVGGTLKVPFSTSEDAQTILSNLQMNDFQVFALSPSGTIPLKNLPKSGRRAFLLGTEGAGLPTSILSSVETVQIPIQNDFDSLNVATASALALYEMFR